MRRKLSTHYFTGYTAFYISMCPLIPLIPLSLLPPYAPIPPPSPIYAVLPPPSLYLPLPLSLVRYGVGYRLIVVKDPSCVSSQVTGLVTSLVDGSKNVTDIGTELSYVLPSGSSHSFPQLFDSLDG